MTKAFLKFKELAFFCLIVIFVFLIAEFSENEEIQRVKAATTSCKGPANVMLVIDRSGNMGNDLKFTSAKSASINFVDKLFSAIPNDSFEPFDYHKIGLVAFNQNIDTEKLNQDGSVIKSYINNSDGILGENNGYPVGSRNTAVAIQQARLKMESVEGANPSGTKTMIVLTDGIPNDLDVAKTQADIAKNEDNNIRIISVGLKLDKITDGTRVKAEEFIKYVASSPADCYYVSDSENVLENCVSIDAGELGTALDGVYNSITAAVCDESDPTITISREPSGTLYNTDHLKIKSTAIDDVGFKSHLISWNDGTVKTVTCPNLAGTIVSCGVGECVEINCDTEEPGQFNVGKTIIYRSAAVDANDNPVNIDPPETVTVASVELTIPALLRNTNNTIIAKILNYGGNDAISISIDAPILEGTEIDKVAMTCTGAGTRTCTYVFNPGCDWTDGITNGTANNINIDVYIYAESGDVGIRQIASSVGNVLTSPGEGNSNGNCSDGLNNDCDYKDNDPLKPIIDLNLGLEEALCDITGPVVGISRYPGGIEDGDVYDFESDTTTPMITPLESTATDSNGIKQHTIYKKEGTAGWTAILDCADGYPEDGKIICNGVEMIQSIATISVNVGPFNPGEKIYYYSEAIDYSGNDNAGTSVTEDFIVKSRECEGITGSDPTACLVNTSGRCCGGVCNLSISNPNSYNTDFCATEICNGISWEWGPANNTVICSESGDSDGCYPYNPDLFGSPLEDPKYFYDGGCQEREYACLSGYCKYTITKNSPDACGYDGNPLKLKDYECSADGLTCQLDPAVPEENTICDVTLDSLSIKAYNNENDFICGGSEATGEVLDNKTTVPNKVSLQSSTSDSNSISEQKIYWKKSTDTSFSVKNCDVASCGTTANSCDCTESIGPFNIGDIVKFYASSKDDSPNQTEKVTATYSFTVRDHQCYNLLSGNIVNLTPCNSGSGMCCGGTCDGAVSATSYDEGCFVDSCSGTNWVSVAGNENVACGISDTCFDWYSPNVDFYSGCMNGGNKCASGYCVLSSAETFPSACTGNFLTNYDCDDYEAGTCQPKDSNIDCSIAGDYDNDTVACNCDCDHYDIEEKVYSSLKFDGVDDYVEVGDVDSWELNLDERMTIEAWVNIDSLKDADIFGKNNNSWAVRNWTWNFYMYSNGDLGFGIGNGVGCDYHPNFYNISTDQWKHVVIVIGAQNENIDFYIDGQFQTGKSITRTLGQLRQTYNSFMVGGKYNYFNGSIDDVRIYNRALYPEEVKHHYNGIFADDTGLVGHWNFDEGTGETADDYHDSTIVNNNTGTLKNGPQWVKYGNGNDKDEYGNVIDVLNRNVPAPWQVCTDLKDNDCDGVADEYDDITGISYCDGEFETVSVTATANKACVYDAEDPCAGPTDLTDLLNASGNNHIEIYDINIKDAINDFTLTANALDDFLIYQTRIEWTADNWSTINGKTCDGTGVCKVCVEGGTCGEGNDEIPSSLLSADNVFKFKVCAVDNSINNNQKCTDEYSIEILSSNAVPIIIPLSVIKPDFCLEGLKYILEWEFSDDGADAQASFEIQVVKENDFESAGDIIINKTFNDVSDLFYQINPDDFEAEKSIEYGGKEYYWRVKVTDNRGGGYSKTTDWEIGPKFTTPLFEYPQVDFNANPDYSDNCLYETDESGTDRCDYGENITFFPQNLKFIECDSDNDKQCLTTTAAQCDTTNNVCVPCEGGPNECNNFNSGGVSYTCESGVCEIDGSCVTDIEVDCCISDSDCIAADIARCDTEVGLCVICNNNSQCEKFNVKNIDKGSSGDVSSGGADTLTDDGKLWVENEWAGGVVKIISGTGSNQSRIIVSNTKEVITVSPNWTTVPNSSSDYKIIKYICNNEGVCEDKEHRKWWFYSDDNLEVDSRDPNPINNYIESEVSDYNVILEIKDITGNSCSRVKKILLGVNKYPKWNEVAPHN